MCGICGIVALNGRQQVDPMSVRRMMDVMSYRGPDDAGMYVSDCAVLGHRRLSIIDLNTGKQPIYNEDGNVCVVFNGEIYNYQEVKKALEAKGHRFATQTDTEVIVHAYEEYGEDCVAQFRGMFVFAVWDARARLLLIGRDRPGIKPLYYCVADDCLIFASEIKAILQNPQIRREVHYPLVDRFLTYLYTPGGETLFKGIYKLKPGHTLALRNGNVSINQYWDLGFSKPDKGATFAQTKARLIELLRESVRQHMISDVPVGFLLSGGVDSTALLSLSRDGANKDLSTFTIGFEGENFADERVYARMAAERYGTKHYEMTIKAQDFADFLPKYVWHMEEPVCEPPAIALYYVSKLAKGHVKVLISGEGGDEAFAGYQTYRNLVWLERFKKVAGPLNGNISALFDCTLSHWNLFKRFRKYSPLLTLPLTDYYLSRTSTPFSFFNRESDALYSPDFRRTVDKSFSTAPTVEFFGKADSQDALDRMLYVDTKTWLPDDLLIKADKMTMANSVELRVPLLDHVVLEFAAGLPSNFKLRGITTKHILKEVFRERVPTEILTRKKTGFPIPYESWLRKDLRALVQDVLLDKRTLQRDYFRKHAIERLLGDNGDKVNYSKEIFSLLTLELWHRQFIDSLDGPTVNS